MQKKLSIVGIVLFVAVSVLFVRSWLKRTESARHMMAQRNSLNLLQEGKEWQFHAAQFNKDKVNVAAIFDGATKVEGFSLLSVGAGKTQFPKAVSQDSGFAARLGAIVLDAKNYPSPGQSIKSCDFDPAVRFRVWKNRKYVDTEICFQCSQVVMLESNSEISIGGDFDVVRPQLLALTKEAFPNDTKIRDIK